jgi:hypothetical protein
VGVAVFDSGLSDTLDKDLEVDRGNLLYLQNNAKRQISNEVFSSPDDDAQGGSITWMFDKAAPVALESLVLADVDRGGDIGLLLEDGAEKTRWYTVPEFWTGQGALTNRPGGSGLLDFSKPSGQSADRRVGKSKSPPLATFTEDAGFDLTDVVSLTAYFKGSGAVGELTFSTADPPPPSSLPEPASLAVFGVLGLVASSAALRRRRCQR